MTVISLGIGSCAAVPLWVTCCRWRARCACKEADYWTQANVALTIVKDEQGRQARTGFSNCETWIVQAQWSAGSHDYRTTRTSWNYILARAPTVMCSRMSSMYPASSMLQTAAHMWQTDLRELHSSTSCARRPLSGVVIG